MRFLLSPLLLAGLTLAAEPYVGISAVQPLASENHAIYRLMPSACLGVRLPRTGMMAFRMGGIGFLGSGSGEYRELRLASATLELGVELRTQSSPGAYVVPAILAGYAAERAPYADTLGNIFDQWNSGTSLGFGLNGGATLYRTGAFRLDAEAGFRFLSVPTGLKHSMYGYDEYAGIDVSTFGVGLVVRFGAHEAEFGGE
jgi:hypothetical protein